MNRMSAPFSNMRVAQQVARAALAEVGGIDVVADELGEAVGSRFFFNPPRRCWMPRPPQARRSPPPLRSRPPAEAPRYGSGHYAPENHARRSPETRPASSATRG